MSEAMDMKLNRLPAITWYWLKMNEAKLAGVETGSESEIKAEIPAGIEAAETAENPLSSQPTGMGKDVTALVEAGTKGVYTLTAPKNRKAAEAARLTFAYNDGANAVNAVNLVLGDNSEMTVIMDYTAEKEAAGFAAVQTKVAVGKYSLLRLVQVVRVGEKFTFLNDVGGRCEDNGRVEIIHLFLDGHDVYQGCQIDLAGYQSSMKTDIAYLVKNDAVLDMNYFANHTGKKTECEINVNGVLRDKATKTFRGTIDFKKGASGAVGNEKEDVLLMDEGVHNQTIPLILCAEEDVVGNHGATIGRLDESLMFYLESRGMDREAINEMLAGARIDALVAQIPDAAAKAEISEYVGGGNTSDDD
ncbi:MAG: SufD family Fe-S cluster assembly protein [Eubacterium sp.]|nr:SufD family Fe-S cluster assembly protein [Eubacterium sp.]